MGSKVERGKRKKWVSPEIREVANLAQIVRTGMGTGKTPNAADGENTEFMN